MESFIAEYGIWFGIASAVIILFERVSKVTPTKTDDKIVAIIHKVAAVVGLDVKDNPGK